MRFVFDVRYSETTVASDYSGQTETELNKIKLKTKRFQFKNEVVQRPEAAQQAAVGQ